MQWSDVIVPPSRRILRQFAALCLVFFVGGAAWRAWHGNAGPFTYGMGAFGLLVGLLGLVQPMAIRWVFTGWMMVAFPIGWTVSKVMIGLMFYAIFTPVAFIFRLLKRDALSLRRPSTASYWIPKETAGDVKEYLRQF